MSTLCSLPKPTGSRSTRGSLRPKAGSSGPLRVFKTPAGTRKDKSIFKTWQTRSLPSSPFRYLQCWVRSLVPQHESGPGPSRAQRIVPCSSRPHTRRRESPMRSPRTINVIKSQPLNTQLPNVLCEEITSALGMSRMVTSRKSSCVVQLQAQLSGIFFFFFVME